LPAVSWKTKTTPVMLSCSNPRPCRYPLSRKRSVQTKKSRSNQ
jgi:hypothetical protein